MSMADDDDKTPPPSLPQLPRLDVVPPSSGPHSIPIELSITGASPKSASSVSVSPSWADGPPTASSPGKRRISFKGLPPGQKVKDYTVVAHIGEGGMGVVYKAAAPGGGFRALKFSLPPESEDAKARKLRIARFQREAGLLLGLVDSEKADNLVVPTELFWFPDEMTGELCIVMPFVEGLTLTAHCRAHRPTLRTILQDLLIPLARVLDYLHSKGICHRDLKPSNVMVDAVGRPLLMDFGISRAVTASTLTGNEALGTLAFAPPWYLMYLTSPERAENARQENSHHGDLFSLGATFFDVLTGLHPYQHLAGGADGSFMSYLLPPFQKALRTFEPLAVSEVNPAVPAELDAFFAAMMAREVERGFSSGDAIAEAAEAVLASLPAPHPLLDAPFTPPPRREGKVSSGPTRGSRPAPEIAPTTPGVAMPKKDSIASPRSAVGFRPPTVGAPVPGFVSPIPSAPESPEMPTGVREGRAQLQATFSRRKLPMPVMVGGGLAALVLVVAFVSSLGQQPKPHSLMDEAAAASPSKAPPAAVSPVLPEAQPVLAPPTPTPQLVAAQTPPAPTPAPTLVPVQSRTPGRAATADGKAVDELLAKEYGGKRPTVGATPGGAAVPGAPTAPTVAIPVPKKKSWVMGDMADAAPTASDSKAMGVPVGSEIPVRLQKPLDSRTIASGPVVARLVRPFLVRGNAVVPLGTMLLGQASATSAGRFNVHFTKLRLADGTEVAIDGAAFDAEDKKPGLRASSRIVGNGQTQGAGVGEQVAKATANVALGKVAGNDVADLGRAGAQVAINQPDSARSSFSGDALLLEAGVDFTVFVQAAF
jgi:serine/threonine-protein kinase